MYPLSWFIPARSRHELSVHNRTPGVQRWMRQSWAQWERLSSSWRERFWRRYVGAKGGKGQEEYLAKSQRFWGELVPELRVQSWVEINWVKDGRGRFSKCSEKRSPDHSMRWGGRRGQGSDSGRQMRAVFTDGKTETREIIQLFRSKGWIWLHLPWLENTGYFHWTTLKRRAQSVEILRK